MLMKKAQLQSNVGRLSGEKLFRLGIGFLLIAGLFTLALLMWERSTAPSQTIDYEGTIVERWADYAETDQGSRPRLALLVESQDGRRFTVKVDPNVYESAKIGMRIRSRAGQIVLIDSDRKATSGK